MLYWLFNHFSEVLEVLTAVVALAIVGRINELSELVLIEVLLDDLVVRLRSIFIAQVQLLKLSFSAVQLATNMVDSLVSLL